MIEVGNTYRADGEDYLCIYVSGKLAWMTSDVERGHAAYTWTTGGKAVSLGPKWDVTFDPRDVEIARLKDRIADLEAAQHRQEPLMGPRNDE